MVTRTPGDHETPDTRCPAGGALRLAGTPTCTTGTTLA